MGLDVKWVDRGREPQCPPNPEHPEGIDVDASHGASKTCQTKLPYPAERCGLYVVKCNSCGMSVALTTAGRTDDPRSVTIACKRQFDA